MVKRKYKPRAAKSKKHNKFFTKKILKITANLLIFIGILLFIFAIYLIWQRNNPNRLSFKNYSINIKNISTVNIPVRIIVSDLGIDIPVIPARVVNNMWDTTIDGASYVVSSNKTGEKGNSIIYAHDWASLFGPLLKIRTGQIVELEYYNKSRKNFVVNNISIVDSNNTSILESGKGRNLILYTCTGFMDSKRFVATAVVREDTKLSASR